jgi:hypothetical protein
LEQQKHHSYATGITKMVMGWNWRKASKNRKTVFVFMVLIMMTAFFAGRHVYYRHQAEKKLDEFIAAYPFPKGKVTIDKLYQPMKEAHAYVKEVHINRKPDNYYVFSYSRDDRKVDLSGVLDHGEWFGMDDALYQKLDYQPSQEFIKKYKHQ